MKLRNKKTGEIVENACIGVFKHQSSGDCERIDAEARSLEKVLEEWEDYEPKEPRINKEDARNAIYSWASLLKIQKVRCKKTAKARGIEVITLEAFELMSAPRIEFTNWSINADLANGGIYEIAELCGEEENERL